MRYLFFLAIAFATPLGFGFVSPSFDVPSVTRNVQQTDTVTRTAHDTITIPLG